MYLPNVFAKFVFIFVVFDVVRFVCAYEEKSHYYYIQDLPNLLIDSVNRIRLIEL